MTKKEITLREHLLSIAPKGGKSTKRKYGKKHYEDMANKRWDNYRHNLKK